MSRSTLILNSGLSPQQTPHARGQASMMLCLLGLHCAERRNWTSFAFMSIHEQGTLRVAVIGNVKDASSWQTIVKG